MMNTTEDYKMIEDNVLIENAILAFLHNYPEHKWVEQYKILLSKVRELKNAKSNSVEVQERRPSTKRQGKKETSSSATSKKEAQIS